MSTAIQDITNVNFTEMYSLADEMFEIAKKAKKLAFQAETLVILEEVKNSKEEPVKFTNADEYLKSLGI